MADNTISPVVPNVSGGRTVSTGQKAVTQTSAQSGIDFKSYLGGRTAVQDNSTTFLKRRNSYTLNKNKTKEISIKTASKNSPTESEVKKITDDISSQIVEKVTDDLDISEDELNNAMQLLGLTAMDLLNPANLSALYCEVTGNASDPQALVLNADFTALFNDVSQVASENDAQLDLLSQLTASDDGEILDADIVSSADTTEKTVDSSYDDTAASGQNINDTDVIYENQTIKSIISNGPLGIDFISAGSSVVGLNNLNHKQIHFIVSAINELNSMYDFIIIDTGAGVSEQVMEFVAASNEIVLVTTPEPTSITDSYSLLKALYKRPDFDPSKVCIRVISNRAASKEDGSIVFNKINSVVMQFLNGSLEYLGYVPSDAMVEKAVRQQKILSIYDPTSKAARSFEEIAKRLLDNESAALDEKRTISHVFSNFFNRKQ